jgi:acetyl esterase/lipase
MRLSMADMPCAFEVRAAVQYGAARGRPYWDGALFLDLLLPAPRPARPVPAIVYLHGGGWRTGDKSAGMMPWLSPLMAAGGFVAANVGYRFTDRSPFPAQIHDVKAAIRWLRANAEDLGIDPARIGVWGDSSGGHLASLLGATAGSAEHEGDCGSSSYSSAVQAVIARCAPSDFTTGMRWNDVLTSLFGGPSQQHGELPRLASPAVFVHKGVPPFLVVHGTADETVPLANANMLVTALREVDADVTFHIVPGGHHNLLAMQEAPWGNEPWTELGFQALEFFSSRLR